MAQPRLPTQLTPLQPHQKRVLEEKAVLDEKIEKLSEFFGGAVYSTLPGEDRALLMEQLMQMQEYSNTLMKRIVRFEPKAEEMRAFERALVAISKAVDGQGAPVLLYRGPNTYEGLRHATFEFMEPFGADAVFINGLETPTVDSQKQAESAAWRNLALLANATAAALDAGL